MKTKDENPTLTKAKLFARRIIFRCVSIPGRAGRGPYQHAPHQHISSPHL